MLLPAQLVLPASTSSTTPQHLEPIMSFVPPLVELRNTYPETAVKIVVQTAYHVQTPLEHATDVATVSRTNTWT